VAEAEALLASAERAKAITPFCVGVSTTAATLALMVPSLLKTIGSTSSISKRWLSQIYLFCPLVSIISATVANLALQETKEYSNKAIGVGNRRFAPSGLVGRTWSIKQEQILVKSQNERAKWKVLIASVSPASIIGSLLLVIPFSGAIITIAKKTIVIAALAAAESAYFLAQAEYTLSRATDAVALKARTSAVCDSYANQGARSAGLLPFTSALSTLCVAATAAIVELPIFVSSSPFAVFGQVVTVSLFPALSALFAGAASVSKARCEVDAEAAVLAASTLAIGYGNEDDNESVIVKPIQKVKELVLLSLRSFERSVRRKMGKLLLQLMSAFQF